MRVISSCLCDLCGLCVSIDLVLKRRERRGRRGETRGCRANSEVSDCLTPRCAVEAHPDLRINVVAGKSDGPAGGQNVNTPGMLASRPGKCGVFQPFVTAGKPFFWSACCRERHLIATPSPGRRGMVEVILLAVGSKAGHVQTSTGQWIGKSAASIDRVTLADLSDQGCLLHPVSDVTKTD